MQTYDFYISNESEIKNNAVQNWIHLLWIISLLDEVATCVTFSKFLQKPCYGLFMQPFSVVYGIARKILCMVEKLEIELLLVTSSKLQNLYSLFVQDVIIDLRNCTSKPSLTTRFLWAWIINHSTGRTTVYLQTTG